MVKSLVYCPVEYGIFSLHLWENATPVFFFWYCPRVRHMHTSLSLTVFFFCESQLTHHWAIAAVPKKKTMTKYLGGGGMGSTD